jgi:hypothetical protein
MLFAGVWSMVQVMSSDSGQRTAGGGLEGPSQALAADKREFAAGRILSWFDRGAAPQ